MRDRVRRATQAGLVAALSLGAAAQTALAAPNAGAPSGSAVGLASQAPGNTGGLLFKGSAMLKQVYYPQVNGDQAAGGSTSYTPPVFGSPCPGGSGVIKVYPHFVMQTQTDYLYEFPDPFTAAQLWQWPGPPPNNDARAVLSGDFLYTPNSGTTGGLNAGQVTDPSKPPSPGDVVTPWGWVYPFADRTSCYGYGMAGKTSCGGDYLHGHGPVYCGQDPFSDPWTEQWRTTDPCVIIAKCLPSFDLQVDPSKRWDKGQVQVIPDPQQTNSTTVTGVPTCAWIAPATNALPTDTVTLQGYKELPTDGPHGPILVSLLYTVTVTPGAVTWNWGDGTSTTTGPGSPPTSDPTYDYTTNTWQPHCANSHTYQQVCPSQVAPTCGYRQITATQHFIVDASVSFATGLPDDVQTDHINTWDIPVAWTGPSLAVKQIESIPVSGG